jgi:hypoxanthine phosphoribosyltransferase
VSDAVPDRPPLLRRWSQQEIMQRVQVLGQEIAAETGDRSLVCIGVLPGSIPFLADLVRCLPSTVEIDFVGVRPVDPARPPEPGRSALSKDLETDIAGRDVLLVDDLVDSGRTMAFLVRTLLARHPASLRICAFLDRPHRRLADLPVSHVGHTVGDELFVGYGIAFGGWFRSCGDIWEVTDPARVRTDPLEALRAAQEAQRSIEGDQTDT